MGVMRILVHSLTSDIRTRSRSKDLDGGDFRILSRSSANTGVNEDRVFLVELGLVTEDGIDDCSVVSYFKDFVIEELTESVCQVGFICAVW